MKNLTVEDTQDNVVPLQVGDKVMLRKDIYRESRDNPTDIVGEVVKVDLSAYFPVEVKWNAGYPWSGYNGYKLSDLILQPTSIPDGYEYRGEIREPREGDEFLASNKSDAPRGYNNLTNYHLGGVRFIVHEIVDKQEILEMKL